jgi:C-terminal processing protease CtpA/Prc
VRARPLWRALLLLDAAERGGADVTLDVIDRQLTGKRPVVVRPGAVAAPVPGSEVRNGIIVARLPVVDGEGAAALGRSLHGGAAAGIVVDLRGVALGTPDGAAQAAAQIAGGDPELTLQMRGGKQQTLKAHGAARSWKVVVCLDGTTAGPAELLAGLLKARGALLVGGESYGDTGQRRAIKGTGGMAWLAVQWGVAPGGAALLGTGLKPDERIRPRKDGDAALDRALELAGGAALAKQAA